MPHALDSRRCFNMLQELMIHRYAYFGLSDSGILPPFFAENADEENVSLEEGAETTKRRSRSSQINSVRVQPYYFV